MTIQKLTMTLSLILTIVGATWWCSQNLVFAAPYNSYKQEQAVRWLMYDERRIWADYQEIKRLGREDAITQRHLKSLEHDLQLKRDEINSLRGR